MDPIADLYDEEDAEAFAKDVEYLVAEGLLLAVPEDDDYRLYPVAA